MDTQEAMGTRVEGTAGAPTRERIYEALRAVYDPELGINVVDLGLVYDVDIHEDGVVTLTMTVTTPGCPMQDAMGRGAAAALGAVPGVTGGEVNIVLDPPWDPARMSEAARRELGLG